MDDSKHELFFNMAHILSQAIKLNENEDLISSFYYKPNSNSSIIMSSSLVNRQVSLTGVSNSIHSAPTASSATTTTTTTANNANNSQSDSTSDVFLSSLERYIYKHGSSMDGVGGGDNLSSSASSLNGNTMHSSNYLLSFYEYCKTLYEYFREKSLPSSSAINCNGGATSFFSILNSSPASLICKLLFEDGIKPQLIETLTQKLHLNLTAIILHNSCPRLKLTLTSTHRVLAGEFLLVSFRLLNEKAEVNRI